jgi:hypothetical protein
MRIVLPEMALIGMERGQFIPMGWISTDENFRKSRAKDAKIAKKMIQSEISSEKMLQARRAMRCSLCKTCRIDSSVL